MATTMKDVARRAGVDVSTVSLAINNDPRIRAETRDRILSIASELGYQKNHLARGLRSGRSYTIGAVVAPRDGAWCEMLTGAQGLLNEQEYHLMLDIAATPTRTEIMQLDSLRAKRVDGLLVAPMDDEAAVPDDELLPLYRSLGEQTPLVLMERSLPGNIADSVTIDNHLGGRLAGQHLLGLGHRHVAFLHTSGYESDANRDRRSGYLEIVQEAGLTPILWEMEPGNGEQAHLAISAHLHRDKDVTAIVAATDTLATATLRALYNEQCRVPADKALISFGGAATHTLCPALSVVALPLQEVGRHAARILMCRIEGDRSPAQHLMIPPTLHVSATCGGGA